MEHIKTLVDNVLTQNLIGSQEKISNKTDLSITWTLAIFKKFSARYIHKWDSAIEGREKEIATEWSSYLSGLTGEDIKRGLENWAEDWPPSCVEFKKACMKIKRAASYHKEIIPNRSIESDELKAQRKSKGISELNKIRKLIN